MVLALLLLSIASAFCVIYPYLIYGQILRRLKTRPIARDPAAQPTVTLVFAAFNEARNIPAKLANIERLKNAHPDIEVLAYDDGSSDATLALLQARPDLVRVVQGKGRLGKAHGMKILASQARGEILLFTDANVTLREDAIENLRPWFGDPEVGGVCGALHYEGAGASATAAVGSRYWRLEEKLKAEESRTGNVMGADGSVFSIRRALYPDFPDTVLDDFTVSMEAVFAGKRLIKVEDVIAYEGLVTNRKDEISRKIRIAARAFHTHLVLRPKLSRMGPLDKFKYVSRKFVRWNGGGLVFVSVASFLLALMLMSPVLGAVVALALGAFAYVGIKSTTGPAASIMEIITALVATQIGVVRAMRGQTFVVWNPAKSR